MQKLFLEKLNKILEELERKSKFKIPIVNKEIDVGFEIEQCVQRILESIETRVDDLFSGRR